MMHAAGAGLHGAEVGPLDDVDLGGGSALAHRKHGRGVAVALILSHRLHVHDRGQDLAGTHQLRHRQRHRTEPADLLV